MLRWGCVWETLGGEWLLARIGHCLRVAALVAVVVVSGGGGDGGG